MFLNIHFHSLLMDGVFIDDGVEKELVFLELMAPTQKEVETLTVKLAHRVTRFIADYKKQQGFDLDDSDLEPLDAARARASQVPLPSRRLDLSADQLGQPEPYRCAFFEGFSLHANVDVPARDREGLLRLVRYGARQAFSQKQLRELDDGRLAYALKRPWGPQGARELILDPTELLHRLAALIPKPYLSLTRFHGIFAPNANRRNEVCPQRSPRRPAHRHPVPADEQEPQQPLSVPQGASRIPWAELLKRTLAVDVLKCPRCLTGSLLVLALITKIDVVLKILSHLNLPSEVPVIAPARLDPQLELDWNPVDDDDDNPAFDVESEPRGPP